MIHPCAKTMLNLTVRDLKIGWSKLNYAYFMVYSPCPKLLIFLYHRVLPKVGHDCLGITVSTSSFKKQIEALARKYPIISLQDALNQCRNNKVHARVQAVLTFDDGYIDNYEIVYPYLKKMGIPAAFFVTTDYVGQSVSIWYNIFFKILSLNKKIKVLKLGERQIIKNTYLPEMFFVRKAIAIMKTLSKAERERAVSLLEEGTDFKKDSVSEYDRFMSWDNLLEMSKQGMEIGSHGMSHSALACIKRQEALDEVRLSRDIISARLNRPCAYFSFPFGGKNDYDAGLIRYCREVGYQACLLNIQGCNYLKKDLFSCRRIIVDESFAIK